MSDEREPHLFDDASAEELTAFARDDLIDYLRLQGVMKTKTQKMSRGALVAEIIRLREHKPESPDTAESELEDGENVDQITPDEARRMDTASDEVILDWLGKHPDARQCLIDYANVVLSRRVELRRADEARRALQSQEPKHFEVVKGGRVPAAHGCLTMLATGSVVNEMTHDLAMLRTHGIELRPIRSVTTEVDSLGMPRTRIER